MDAGAVAAGLGAVLTGAGGCILVINEYRRRDRKAARDALDTYSEELYSLGQSYIELRHYNFEVRKQLADQGVDTPPPPQPLKPVAPVIPIQAPLDDEPAVKKVE